MKKLIVVLTSLTFSFALVGDASADNWLSKRAKRHRRNLEKAHSLARDAASHVSRLVGDGGYYGGHRYPQAYAGGRIYYGYSHGFGYGYTGVYYPYGGNYYGGYSGMPTYYPYYGRGYSSSWSDCRVVITDQFLPYCTVHRSYSCEVLGNYSAYADYVDPSLHVLRYLGDSQDIVCIAHTTRCGQYPWPKQDRRDSRRDSSYRDRESTRFDSRNRNNDYRTGGGEYSDEEDELRDRSRRFSARHSAAPNILLVPILLDRGCPEGYSASGETDVDSKKRLCHVCVRDPEEDPQD